MLQNGIADHWAVEGDGINTRDATMSKPGGGEGTRTEFTLVDAVCLVREHRRVFCVFADMNIKFDGELYFHHRLTRFLRGPHPGDDSESMLPSWE